MKNTMGLKVGLIRGNLTLMSSTVQFFGRMNLVVWKCNCACGVKGKEYVQRAMARKDFSWSCECVSEINHRMPERNVWGCMKKRCTSDAIGEDRKRYYERGIRVCQRWIDSFDAFLKDMGLRPSNKHTLERVNNNKGYYPENCKWATRREQARNRRSNRLITIDGQTKLLSDWADDYGIDRGCLTARLQRGWSPKESVMTPSRRKKSKGTEHV